jgi:hypothetical protein
MVDLPGLVRSLGTVSCIRGDSTCTCGTYVRTRVDAPTIRCC